MIIALIVVIVVVVLLLIVLGLRALGAGGAGDDYDGYEDDYDAEEDEGAEDSRSRRSSRRAFARDDEGGLDEEAGEDTPAPRSRGGRRPRAGADPRSARRPRSRRSRDDDWGEDDDYFSSLYEDSPGDDFSRDSDWDEPEPPRRDTRNESTQAMPIAVDDEYTDDEPQHAPGHQSQSPAGEPASSGADPLAMLASLGQDGAAPAPHSPVPPASGESLGGLVHSEPVPAPQPAASATPARGWDPAASASGEPHRSWEPRADNDPLGSPTPPPYDTGSHSRSASYGTDPLAPSYDTGSHTRSGYDPATTPPPYDTGSHSRSGYGGGGIPPGTSAPPTPADPLTDPSFTPAPLSGADTGSPIWSSMDTGSHQRPPAPPVSSGPAPTGGQQPFGGSAHPSGGQPATGHGPSYSSGSFTTYDTGTYSQSDYPPPAPQQPQTYQSYPDVLGADFLQGDPPPPSGYDPGPGYDAPPGGWPPYEQSTPPYDPPGRPAPDSPYGDGYR